MNSPIKVIVNDDNTRTLAWNWASAFELGEDIFMIRIKAGFKFDGASIPRFLWRFCGHPYLMPRLEAALVHDWLYAAKVTTRREADRIYRNISRDVHIGFIQRWTEYLALRLFGGAAWKSHNLYEQEQARKHGELENLLKP